MSIASWQLWYHDLFDRECDSLEAEGEGLLEGLTLLWRKEAAEGIDDDGARTFTAFSLRWDGGRADLDLGRHNPGLANIRRWDAADAAARAHLRLIERSGAAAEILACAEQSRDAQELAERLSRR